MAGVVRRIRAETGLAVTLSLGERSEADLRAWREAGADRYLLRFETSNPALYRKIHPPRRGRRGDRIALLRLLRGLGYEVGSGVMIGIPGQTYADLARDLELFRELDLDMIGVGPFLPHPATPLGRDAGTGTGDGESPIEHRTSNIEHRTSNCNPQSAIRNPDSNTKDTEPGKQGSIRNPQFAIRNWNRNSATPAIRNPKSEIRCPTSEFAYSNRFRTRS